MTVRHVFVFCLVCSFALFACNAESGPTAADTGGLVVAASGPSASGHVDIDEIPPAFGTLNHEQYSFNARVQKNGDVHGRFEIRDDFAGGDKFHTRGDVLCLVVEPDGKTARMSGIVTASDFDGFEGTYAVWTVVDNGEGKNSPPDQATDIRFGLGEATATTHCETGIDPAAFGTFQDNNRGNVQVRP